MLAVGKYTSSFFMIRFHLHQPFCRSPLPAVGAVGSLALCQLCCWIHFGIVCSFALCKWCDRRRYWQCWVGEVSVSTICSRPAAFFPKQFTVGFIRRKKRGVHRLVAWVWLGRGLGVAWAWLGRGLGVWAWLGRGRGFGVQMAVPGMAQQLQMLLFETLIFQKPTWNTKSTFKLQNYNFKMQKSAFHT